MVYKCAQAAAENYEGKNCIEKSVVNCKIHFLQDFVDSKENYNCCYGIDYRVDKVIPAHRVIYRVYEVLLYETHDSLQIYALKKLSGGHCWENWFWKLSTLSERRTITHVWTYLSRKIM